MESVDLFKIIIKIYEELYRQATMSDNFTFRNNDNEVKMIWRFIEWFQKTYPNQQNIGVIIKYFEFQFSHYEGVITSYGKNSIMIGWIIGKKAQERWMSRDIKKYWVVRYRLNKEVGLKLQRIFKTKQQLLKLHQNKKLLTKIHDYEEKDKQRFYNTEKGFVYCTIMTTMFNPISIWCNGCKYKEICEKTLLHNLPKTHTVRCQQKMMNLNR